MFLQPNSYLLNVLLPPENPYFSPYRDFVFGAKKAGEEWLQRNKHIAEIP